MTCQTILKTYFSRREKFLAKRWLTAEIGVRINFLIIIFAAVVKGVALPQALEMPTAAYIAMALYKVLINYISGKNVKK